MQTARQLDTWAGSDGGVAVTVTQERPQGATWVLVTD